MSSEDVAGKFNKTRKGPLIGLLFFALLIGLWWGVPNYRKAKADAMVRELCAKDGGMKVYETVKLPTERFDQYGLVRFGSLGLPPLKQNMKSEDDFYYTSEINWMIPETSVGALAMWRLDQKLFRAADHKLLAVAISYSRRGGDPIGPWHPSSYRCPPNADITVAVRRVFERQ